MNPNKDSPSPMCLHARGCVTGAGDARRPRLTSV